MWFEIVPQSLPKDWVAGERHFPLLCSSSLTLTHQKPFLHQTVVGPPFGVGRRWIRGRLCLFVRAPLCIMRLMRHFPEIAHGVSSTFWAQDLVPVLDGAFSCGCAGSFRFGIRHRCSCSPNDSISRAASEESYMCLEGP